MTAEITDDLGAASMPALFDVNPEDHVLSLAERFILPPFTQLDGRSGAWQDRKRLWLDMGLASEEGRDAKTFGKGGGKDEVTQKILALSGGQSIFDPVLCEMAYRWFVPPGGHVLDPFAGGSVRGLVAGVTRRRYTGIDLSARQIEANNEQADRFVDQRLLPEDYVPEWIVGDSREVLADLDADEYDFVWSCPPYHDLEVYSDDPADLSNMHWPEFRGAYRDIIGAAVDRLAWDRFAAFVVGEIRGPDGFYRNFVGETVDAFEAAGAGYYNEALFVSPAGTLPLRAAKQFVTSRKMGRTHQTLLVFCKGDPKAAAAACRDTKAEEAALRAMGRSLDDLTDDEDGAVAASG